MHSKIVRSVQVEGTYAGIRVVPDAVELPLLITAYGESPPGAILQAKRLLTELDRAVEASYHLVSHHTKRVGSGSSGMFHRGERHELVIRLFFRKELGTELSFLERLGVLERLRSQVLPFVSEEVIVGEAVYRVLNLQAYESQLADHLRVQLSRAESQGLVVRRLVLRPSVAVQVVGPDQAYLSQIEALEFCAESLCSK